MFTPRELIEIAQTIGSDIDLGNATTAELVNLVSEAFRIQIETHLS